MRKAALLAVLLLLSASPSQAEESVTAAATTERGRSLDRILDNVLLPEGRAIQGRRTLYLLLDPSPSLGHAGFVDALEGALGRTAERLGDTEIGVARMGGKGKPLLSPTADFAEVVTVTGQVVGQPDTSFQNVYAEARRVIVALKRQRGRRDLVMVTLENGDGEDDVDGVISLARGAGVQVHVVAREAFLSDTWWVTHASQGPRGVDLAGSDAAFIEMPWGFLWQRGVLNEFVASGFPMYGISRLAQETGGRVWLFYPPSTTAHRCSQYAGCPFCSGDHLPNDHAYLTHRLKALAPNTGARRNAYVAAARDPYYRAVLEAWERASKKGLVRSRPSVKRSGSTLQPQRRQTAAWAALTGTTSFSGLASRAERLLAPLDEIRADLETAIERAAAGGAGSERYRAMAETTRVLLQLTRVNLVLFASFCREVAPVLAHRKTARIKPPEIPLYRDEERFTGVGYTNMSLCHGVKPYFELYLPGGDDVREELEELDRLVTPFLERYAHTPFAALVRSSGLARFHLTVRGKYVAPPKRNIPGSTSEETTTKTDRPARGGPTTGGSGGPTTGGD